MDLFSPSAKSFPVRSMERTQRRCFSNNVAVVLSNFAVLMRKFSFNGSSDDHQRMATDHGKVFSGSILPSEIASELRSSTWD
jgi:hypothetical protein